MAIEDINNVITQLNQVDTLASQYANSATFRKWVNIYNNETDELCLGVCGLASFFKIDAANGVWLDVLGIIVGQPRSTIDSTLLDIFGFEPDVTNFGFDDGVWTDGQYGNAVLDADDVIYRRMIKARALKNVSRGSIPDIIKSINILTGGRTDFQLTGLGTVMQFGINFDSALDSSSEVLLTEFDLMPRGACVKLTGVTY